jgi:hypothetical protein
MVPVFFCTSNRNKNVLLFAFLPFTIIEVFCNLVFYSSCLVSALGEWNFGIHKKLAAKFFNLDGFTLFLANDGRKESSIRNHPLD